MGHLLDLIISKDDENSKALFELIQNIQESTIRKRNSFSLDQTDKLEYFCFLFPLSISLRFSLSNELPTDKLNENKGEGNTGLIDTLQDKKLKAQDRRRRVIANMAQKQKAFANAHELDFITKGSLYYFLGCLD